MMFALTILCVSFLVSLVHASPLYMRDVFSPHITSPDENTVWPVGTKQTVTWETKDIPPDSQLTNPNGKVVLGHLGPTGGLNLQLESPLAQNFKLRVGQIEITVPSVPPRDDYIIVLFGDSGNASPAFAITRITGGSNSTTSAQPTTTPQSSSATSSVPTPITEPIPITGTTITGGISTPSNEPTTTVDLPSSSGITSPLSTQTGTAAPASTSNSAWGSHHLGAKTTAGVASLVLTFLICI
ncbi:hypothetical protein D9615_003034 [Tricholomella constricta]|uniref:Uncharacterized protein n=1 Tax=Tricholomella constricta TaxID=117010 RepID=A0A8H5HGC0_9AGAR|nr:hypothetical protein D9615_003034 [Tricholomella constricta]